MVANSNAFYDAKMRALEARVNSAELQTARTELKLAKAREILRRASPDQIEQLKIVLQLNDAL